MLYDYIKKLYIQKDLFEVDDHQIDHIQFGERTTLMKSDIKNIIIVFNHFLVRGQDDEFIYTSKYFGDHERLYQALIDKNYPVDKALDFPKDYDPGINYRKLYHEAHIYDEGMI